MTIDEFKALKAHARIKYIGTRPAETTFFGHNEECPTIAKKKSALPLNVNYFKSNGCHYACTSIPKTFLSRGIIVSSVSSWSGKLALYYYGGIIENAKPIEWELVDARSWVEGEANYKRAKSYIPFTVNKFKEDLKTYLKEYKRRIELKVDDLPIDKKLKVIMELSPEDKKWFGIMSSDPEEAIRAIEKAFEDDPA
jgi:hypothetical protein